MVSALGTELEQDAKPPLCGLVQSRRETRAERGGSCFQCCGQEGPQTRRPKKGRNPRAAVGTPCVSTAGKQNQGAAKGIRDTVEMREVDSKQVRPALRRRATHHVAWKGPQKGKTPPALLRALSVQGKAHPHLGQCHGSPAVTRDTALPLSHHKTSCPHL